jgi:hypothetical protein
MTDPPTSPLLAAATPTRLRRFGYRNVMYIGFMLILVVSTHLHAMNAPGPREIGEHIAIAGIIYMAASVIFLAVNGGLLAIALVRKRSAAKPALACALAGAALLPLLIEGLTETAPN